VNKADTTATLTSSLNPSTFGQSTTLTVTVVGGGAPVSDGSVTFKEGTTVLAGPMAVNTSGQASFNTSVLSAGTHTITAEYSGGSSFNPSVGSVAQIVNKATATVTLSNLTQTFTGSALSPTATTTPAGLAIIWTGAPQTNAGTYPVTATVNDANYQGSASGTFVITATAATATSTLTVSSLTPQYGDQDTFTVTVTSSAPGQPAAGVAFSVGTQQVGSPTPVTVPLTPVGDPATTTTYQAVWTGQLLEPTPFGSTPTGQMKPGLHLVSASFVNPNFSITKPTNKSVNITREDARIAGLDRTSYSLGGSATGTVPLTVTVKDITAMLGDPAYDAYPGDIRNAQVQFIDRATNTVLGTANVASLIGSGTTTGTATFNWSVNLGTATSKSYTIGFAVLNYYTRNSTADNVVVTVSK